LDPAFAGSNPAAPANTINGIPRPDEIKALVGAATDKALALVCLGTFAGLRASEIRGLRWIDLKLDTHPTVTISQRADRSAQIGSPKSDAAQRTIPLGEPAAQALRAWKLAQPPITYREDAEKRQRPATLVFGTRMDRPDTLPNIRSRLLAPAMVRAGVAVPVLDDDNRPVKGKEGSSVMRPKYGGLHCLRHYAVSTWLRTCGGDFKQVQAWAGHATLAITLDTYGHLTPRKDGHEIMRAVERDLFG
jgi:integrase